MPRPDNWSLTSEGFIKVTKTDYFGNEYQAWEKPKKDLGKAWASFREQFRSQPTKELKPGNQYRPNMSQIDFNNIENPNSN